MKLELSSARPILARTPATLSALVGGLPEAWTHANEGPDTWSVFDVVGHLIQGELRDWIPRARIILEHGAAKAFEPFDRFAQLEAEKGKPLGELLDRFADLRRQNLIALEELRLTPDQMALEGRHPELGTVTLGQLLSTWVVHDLGHIRQVARVMAKQYATEVGPWKAYTTILGE
jgi:DinB superfamily